MDDKVAKVFVIVDLKLENALKHSKFICYFHFPNDLIPLLNSLNKMHFRPILWMEINTFWKSLSFSPD